MLFEQRYLDFIAHDFAIGSKRKINSSKFCPRWQLPRIVHGLQDAELRIMLRAKFCETASVIGFHRSSEYSNLTPACQSPFIVWLFKHIVRSSECNEHDACDSSYFVCMLSVQSCIFPEEGTEAFLVLQLQFDCPCRFIFF